MPSDTSVTPDSECGQLYDSNKPKSETFGWLGGENQLCSPSSPLLQCFPYFKGVYELNSFGLFTSELLDTRAFCRAPECWIPMPGSHPSTICSSCPWSVPARRCHNSGPRPSSSIIPFGLSSPSYSPADRMQDHYFVIPGCLWVTMSSSIP